MNDAAPQQPEPVRDLHHLAKLARQRRSIQVSGAAWHGHQGYAPAAWAINWPASVVLRLLPKMTVYTPKGRKCKPQQ